MGKYARTLIEHPDAIDLSDDRFAADDVLTFMREGSPVGFMVATGRSDGNAELDGLFVEPALLRSGIGARLVEKAF